MIVSLNKLSFELYTKIIEYARYFTFYYHLEKVFWSKITSRNIWKTLKILNEIMRNR